VLSFDPRSLYERALAYDPSSADALYNLGVLEGASGSRVPC
jgi:hypothetical protein